MGTVRGQNSLQTETVVGMELSRGEAAGSVSLSHPRKPLPVLRGNNLKQNDFRTTRRTAH